MKARHQCPFVNRPDGRCSQKLSIDRLDHAFEFCFDAYNVCPVYLERLVERRARVTRDTVLVKRENEYGSSYIQLRTPLAARATAGA